MNIRACANNESKRVTWKKWKRKFDELANVVSISRKKREYKKQK